jgi:hypothetical protein
VFSQSSNCTPRRNWFTKPATLAPNGFGAGARRLEIPKPLLFGLIGVFETLPIIMRRIFWPYGRARGMRTDVLAIQAVARFAQTTRPSSQSEWPADLCEKRQVTLRCREAIDDDQSRKEGDLLRRALVRATNFGRARSPRAAFFHSLPIAIVRAPSLRLVLGL